MKRPTMSQALDAAQERIHELELERDALMADVHDLQAAADDLLAERDEALDTVRTLTEELAVPDVADATENLVVLSATRRLTIRNRGQLDRGVHPATGLPLMDHALFTGTCGTCSHHHAYNWHNRTYHKCDVHRLGESHSAASDIRTSWPGCVLHEAAT